MIVIKESPGKELCQYGEMRGPSNSPHEKNHIRMSES